MSTYCFDIDGTLCITTDADYENSTPIKSRITVVNQLFNEGHKIILFTARGSKTGIDWTNLTTAQLNDWGVKYHVLKLGKPFADLYIDDKGMNDNDFFYKLKS